MTALLPLSTWVPILDGDPVAAQIYLAHYSSERSRQRRLDRGTLQIGGPSERLLLSTPDRRSLFGWRRMKFRADGQRGVECFIFANHGAGLSSDLIRAADAIADQYWKGERHFTFVDPNKVSANPGYCFKMAGWRFCGLTKARRLHILERPATGDRRPATGDRRPATGDRRPATGDRVG